MSDTIARTHFITGLRATHDPSRNTGWHEVLAGPNGTLDVRGDHTGHVEKATLLDGSVHEVEVYGEGKDYQLIDLIRDA